MGKAFIEKFYGWLIEFQTWNGRGDPKFGATPSKVSKLGSTSFLNVQMMLTSFSDPVFVSDFRKP